MKNLYLIVSLILAAVLTDCNSDDTKYIDPNIGGVAPLLTTPGPTVHRPNSMVRVFPLTEPNLSDRYLSDKIYGFPLNIIAYRLEHSGSLMPSTGKVSLNKDTLASLYDHSLEEVHPWYHKVWLQDPDVDAAWTTTERAVIYSFNYNRSGENNLLMRFDGKARIESLSDKSLSGWQEFSGMKMYFYSELNYPVKHIHLFSQDSARDSKVVESINPSAVLIYEGKLALEIRTGISYISVEQAKKNLDTETKDKSFEQLKEESHSIWKKCIGKIEVEGGTDKERRIFYTSLYRAFERMVNISEDGKYYSGYDKQIHKDNGDPFYTDDWLWDTYRSLHPLMTILCPSVQLNQLKSYIRMYQQSGWMPLFPQVYGDEPFMLGNHSAVLFADAVAKGLKGFDLEKAYQGIRKNSLEGTLLPWRNGPKTKLDDFYNLHGWFPALPTDSVEIYPEVHPWEKRQSVSVTLEQSTDDGCTAILAKALGKKEDYNLFMKRSRFYRNQYNPATGFMSPKLSDGGWMEPFDPQLSAWYGSRMYFTENNSWTWTWSVTHDIPGLIKLMGGKDNFSRRLDDLFNTGPQIGKWKFMGQFPDATGLHGMFVAGNEPSFHIPYLYNYVGDYWKTQRRIRQVMEVWFDDTPLGLPGDEDGGAMCSWYVLSAMGFYPVRPGTGEYAIGSPFFNKICIHLENGKTFTIIAHNCSVVNKYIQRADLNGKKLKVLFFMHKDIVNGGSLVMEMGPRPMLKY